MGTIPLIDPGPENQTSRATPQIATGIAPGEPVSAADGENLARALGQAVTLCWHRLSHDAQQSLFEAAVGTEGENIRHKLAMFLHEKHARTRASVHARAIAEPDSLGG